MPSAAAQDEFDALFGSGKETSLPHPEDVAEEEARSIHSSHSSSLGDATARDPEKKTLRSSAAHRHSQRDDSDSDAEQQARTSTKMRSRYFIPSTRSEANTGPKGVIADAQAFEQARRAHRGVMPRLFKKHHHNNTPEPTSTAALPNTSSSSYHIAHHHNTNTNTNHQRSSNFTHADSWLMEPDEDDESDDDFLARWRQTRLQELSKSHTRHGYAGRRSTSSPRYGSLQTVDAEGYLDAIEQARRDAVVIVFIYDDMSEVSLLIEHCVQNIARAYPSTRFVKLHYEQAQMEPAGVPAMLAYRGGDKFADMVPMLDEIPEDDELSADTLAIAMKRKGMLP